MPGLRLIHRSSVLKGKELVVDAPVVRLGRDPACEVLFDERADRTVSRQHAELRWEGGRLLAAPMPGKVVLLGGREIAGPTLLYPGDVIELAGPGGPSVEVQWDGPRRPLIGATSLAQVDDTASTATNLPALQPAPEPAPVALPSESHRTMMLPALAPSESTPYLAPVNAPKRRPWLVPIATGAAVLVVAAAVAAGVWRHERAERRREAIARVEKIKAALANRQNAPAISDDDWKIYEDEYGHQARPKPFVTAMAPPSETAPAKAATATERQDADLAEKHREAEAVGLQRTQAAQAFAAWKRLELDRLALGRKAPPPSLVEQRKDALQAYESLDAPLLADMKGTDALLLEAARHLGECDAAMPPKLLLAAKAAVQRFRKDGAEHDRLVTTLETARQHRYGPTITAALGDQRVPVELFFIPFEQSGFDERKVGFITPMGYPKGMWQLVPPVAQSYGLHLGGEAANPGYDSADERFKYERESRAAAKLLRALYAGPAAASALVVIASYDHGDAGRLRAMKEKAGLAFDDKDPARVNLWNLYQKKALDDDAVKAAATAIAEVAIATHPGAFGFSFPLPLEHVAIADE